MRVHDKSNIIIVNRKSIYYVKESTRKEFSELAQKTIVIHKFKLKNVSKKIKTPIDSPIKII